MNREELEILRQELDQQGCDTYMRGADTFDAEYVSYVSTEGKDWYGSNVDFDSIASLCYRSDEEQVEVSIFEDQNPQHWSITFERGENFIDLMVHPYDRYIRVEIIGAACYLKELPELVIFAQNYLVRNWKRITDGFWERAHRDMKTLQCS